MFDTPELMPLCIAPFVGLGVGIVLYAINGAITDWIGKKKGNIPNWWKSTAFFFVVAVAMAACFASVALEIGVSEPAPWFTPTAKNVVGTWVLTSEDVEFLENSRDIPVRPHELVFEDNGTFHVSDIPTFWGLFDKEKKAWNAKYSSGSGTWHLGQIEGTRRAEWIVFAQFQEIDGKSIDTANQDWLIRFYFVGHLPPYVLRSMDGDLGFDFGKK